MNMLVRLVKLVSTSLWYAFVVLVVTVAVGLTVARLVVPEVGTYRARVEASVSASLGQPVRIGGLDARLVGLHPTLILKDVQLLARQSHAPLVRFAELRLELASLASIRARRLVPAGLTVKGARLSVVRSAEGSLSVRGLHMPAAAPGAGARLAQWFLERDYLSLEDSTLEWTQEGRHGLPPLRLSAVNLSLRNHRGRHQLDGALSLSGAEGEALRVAVDATGVGTDLRDWAGRFYLEGRGISAAAWRARFPGAEHALRSGRFDFHLWGAWESGVLARLSGEVQARELQLKAGTAPGFTARRVGGRLHWRREAHGWRLDVDRFGLRTPGHRWPRSRWSLSRHAADWQLRLGYARVDDLAAMLLASGRGDAQLRAALAGLQPRGELRGAELRLAPDAPGAARYRLRARFTGVAVRPYRELPGWAALDGRLWADARGGTLWVDPQPLTVELPRLFRAPLAAERLAGRVQWQRDALGAWRVRASDLRVRTADVAAAGAALLVLPPASAAPFLDLQLHFEDGDLGAAVRYLPVGIMSPQLVHWLEQAHLRGRVEEGGLVYHGPLQPLPFDKGAGRFLVDFDVRDTALRYQHEWPPLQHADGRLRFTDRGMAAELSAGMVAGNPLHATVHIADFKQAEVRLAVDADSDASALLGFLDSGPAEGGLAALRASGTTGLHAEVDIPLPHQGQARAPPRYRGTLALRGVDLALAGSGIDARGLRGQLAFSDAGLQAEGLAGRLFGGEGRVGIDTRAGTVAVHAAGRVDDAALKARLSSPAAQRLRGAARWAGEAQFAWPPRSGADLQLSLHSDLQGLALELPAPLSKAAAPALPFTAAAHCRARLCTVNTRVEGRLAAALQLDDTSAGGWRLRRGELRGGGQAASLPAGEVLRVSGTLERFSPGRWRALLPQPVQRAGGALPVELALDRLGLMPAEPAPGRQAAPPDPAAMPPVHGRIKALSYAGMPLGTAEISAAPAPTGDGLQVRFLTLSSPALRLQASGSWERRGHLQHTRLELTAASDHVGRLLTQLGYASVIRGGGGQLDARLSWPRPPWDLDVADLAGELNLHLRDGQIEEVGPGAGRVVGLLSLQALPRRLRLDFSDVFGKGFAFDTIDGRFSLAAGNAYTRALQIKGPSADIAISGRTGLAARDYDQRVAVTPQVGESLPVAGSLAWGPQVGAAILLFQKLFKSQIDSAARIHYRITGSWDRPQVERLSDAPGRDAKAPQ